MTRHGLEAADVLSDGEWQTQGGVLVWVAWNSPHPLCGTDSGYYRHRRQLDEAACGDCLTAHRLAERNRVRRRREKAA